MDLNQDDNNKSIKHDNEDSSIKVNDDNAASDNDDVKTDDADSDVKDVKTADSAGENLKSTDLDIKDVKTDIAKSDEVKDLTLKENESDEKADLNLKVNVIRNDKDGVTIEINSNKSFNGVVKVKTSYNDRLQYASLTNGHGYLSIGNFKPGYYNVYVTYEGGPVFKTSQAVVGFNVEDSRTFPALKLCINSINLGEVAHAYVYAYNGFNGTANLKITNSGKTVYTEELKFDGSFNQYKLVDIPNLKTGNYSAEVTYDGDEYFKPDSSHISFKVIDNRLDPDFRIKVVPYENGDVSVDAFVNKNATGKIQFKFDDEDATTYHVKKGHVGIMNSQPQGNHTVTVSYEGDKNYAPAQVSQSFTIKGRTHPDLKVSIDDIEEGRYPEITVTADSSFNRTVHLKLNNSDSPVDYPITMRNGKGFLFLTDEKLEPGEYLATVTFDGDDDFLPDSAVKGFKVNAIEKIDPNFRVEVKDTIEGRAADVRVYTDTDYEGPIYIKLNNSDKVYTLPHVKGSAWSLHKIHNLTAGNYTATASFEGNDKYLPSESSASFQVIPKKIDPEFRVEVKDILEGRAASVRVYANENYEGPIYIKLNSSDEVYTLKHNKGSAWTLQNIYGLAPGNYTATASFEGNDKYLPSYSSARFEVIPKKIDPNLRVEVADVNYSNRTFVEIHANESFNGTVNLKFNASGINHPVNIENGYGSISPMEILAPGVYTATVSFDGDDTYQSSQASTSFMVFENERADPKLRVSISSVTAYEDASVMVSTDKSVKTGLVNIELSNGKTCSVDIVNGIGRSKISGLPAGNYTAKAKFVQTPFFNASECDVKFMIDYADANLSISVPDITREQRAMAEIHANKNLNGNVFVKVNDSNIIHLVNLSNGSGEVEFIEDLAEGNHTASVYFLGNDYIKAGNAQTSFEVDKEDPALSINVDDITAGEKPVAKVRSNKNLKGEANIIINDSDTVYHLKVSHGYAKETIDDDMEPGEYTATVEYDGDDTFKASESSTSFIVSDAPGTEDPNLNVKVNDITEGENANVEITANSTLNGDVLVKLNNSANVTVKVVNGVGSAPISNLHAGTYTATAIFDGDNTFKAVNKSTSFTVKQKPADSNQNAPAGTLANPNLKVTVKNIEYGQKATVTVTADAKFNGNVAVKVGTKSYNVKVTNGKGSLSVSGLKVGTYAVQASSSQNDLFKAASVSASFKVNNQIKLTLTKAKVKKSAKKLTLKSTLKVNGKVAKNKIVTFKFKGKTYKVKTNKKGIATLVIKKNVLKKLKAGKKITYTAKYSTKTVKKTVKVKR